MDVKLEKFIHPRRGQPVKNKQRDNEIRLRWSSRDTVENIAKDYKISPSRVRAIIHFK